MTELKESIVKEIYKNNSGLLTTIGFIGKVFYILTFLFIIMSILKLDYVYVLLTVGSIVSFGLIKYLTRRWLMYKVTNVFKQDKYKKIIQEEIEERVEELTVIKITI